MKIKTCRLSSALFAAMLMVVPIISFGQGNLPAVTVDVYQFISPIIPDSPNSAQTVANFYNGVQNGNWPAGSSLTPAFVSLIPNGGSVSVLQTLYTPAFHSWNGLANPSGAFAGEYGQNVQYAFVIHSLSLFTLSQVGYTNTASGSATDSGTFAGLHYGPNTGSGGVTGGPTYSTGNGDTTQVNWAVILWGGEANIVQPGQTIDQVVSNYRNPETFGFTVCLGGVSATQSLTVQPVQSVPEPSTIALSLTGAMAMLLLLKRKK